MLIILWPFMAQLKRQMNFLHIVTAICSACQRQALGFFTVYGPWGRPDMALFKFTEAMVKGRPIDIYNHGQMIRDFTYIDDVVEAIVQLGLQAWLCSHDDFDSQFGYQMHEYKQCALADFQYWKWPAHVADGLYFRA